MSRFTGITFKQDDDRKLRYVPALDGLRALAIIAVMLFHLKTKSVFPGGGMGVDLFFVLSGFLITTLLLQEWTKAETISLKAFYTRRALRLLPAVAIFVATYVAINVFFHSSEFTGRQSGDLLLRNVVLISTYGFNWLIASGGIAGKGLSHLWSLSVEEQFYLVWPALLLLALRARVGAPVIMAVSAVVALASASLPFTSGGDWARLYYGTDFRLQSLMLGSLLGQLHVAGALKPAFTRTPFFRTTLILAALLFAFVILFGRSESAVLFHGGHTVVAVCSSVLIIGALFAERNRYASVLSNPILVYIGRRSYALYLWHAAINVWLQSFDPLPHFVMTVFLSLLAAELSYRLVEAPALGLKTRLSQARRNPNGPIISPTPEAERGVAA